MPAPESPRAPRAFTPRSNGMVVVDFDGTLRSPTGAVSAADAEALETARRAGLVRVLATGRSLYSLERTLGPSGLSVDYVVFSSGAGVRREADAVLVRKSDLRAAEVERTAEAMLAAGLDFMIHLPVPGNHRFSYHASGGENPDFTRRIQLYEGLCRPLCEDAGSFGEAAQVLAVVPPDRDLSALESLRRSLSGLTVLRATSPLDGRSTWIEVFPQGVSKGQTVAWLARRLAVGRDAVLAVGNDYNDVDLLEWAGAGWVVANAPPELTARFPTVGSNAEGGVAEAVARWLEGRNRRSPGDLEPSGGGIGGKRPRP